MSLRDLILSAKDCSTIKVNIPEWNVDVWVTSWSGRDRAAIQMLHSDSNKINDLTSRVVAMSVVDEQGTKQFTLKDVDALSEKNGEVLERLALQCLRHNGLAKAEDGESEAKNS